MNKNIVFGLFVLLLSLSNDLFSLPRSDSSEPNLEEQVILQPGSAAVAELGSMEGQPGDPPEQDPLTRILGYELAYFIPSSPEELRPYSAIWIYWLAAVKTALGSVLAVAGNPLAGAGLIGSAGISTGLNMKLESHRHAPSSTANLFTKTYELNGVLKSSILEVIELGKGKDALCFEWDTAKKVKDKGYCTAPLLSTWNDKTTTTCGNRSVHLEPLKITIWECQGECSLREGPCQFPCKKLLQEIIPPISVPQVTFGCIALSACARYLAIADNTGGVSILNATCDDPDQDGWHWAQKYVIKHRAHPSEITQNHHRFLRTLHGHAVLTNKGLPSGPEDRKYD